MATRRNSLGMLGTLVGLGLTLPAMSKASDIRDEAGPVAGAAVGPTKKVGVEQAFTAVTARRRKASWGKDIDSFACDMKRVDAGHGANDTLIRKIMRKVSHVRRTEGFDGFAGFGVVRRVGWPGPRHSNPN